MLEQAFALMGGTQDGGLSVTQLHRAIRNQQERVTEEFLRQMSSLMILHDKNKPEKGSDNEIDDLQDKIFEYKSDTAQQKRTKSDIFSSGSAASENEYSGYDTGSFKNNSID